MSKGYACTWSHWSSWCLARQADPSLASVTLVVNFLAELFSKGKSYSTLNCFYSAISAHHYLVGGRPIGQDPLVCRLLRGARLSRPMVPCYSVFWDVTKLLNLFRSWPDNPSLAHNQLSDRLTIILCLISFHQTSVSLIITFFPRRGVFFGYPSFFFLGFLSLLPGGAFPLCCSMPSVIPGPHF